MKKYVFIVCCLFLRMGFGIEYSLRIKALGPDFAYLIPDYETDLYRYTDMYTRDNKFVEVIPGVPFTVKLLTSRFGLMGEYNVNYDFYYSPTNYWEKNYWFTINDLWMWDARKLLPGFLGDVWNVTNDVYWYDDKIIRLPSYSKNHLTKLQYILGIPGSGNIGKYFKHYGVAACGLYLNKYNYNDYTVYLDQRLLFVSGKAGISYRRFRSDNDFVSAYIEISGPVTNAEVDALPWPVFSYMLSDIDSRISNFLQTLIARTAFVKGIPINEQSFVAFGIRNQYLCQHIDQADTNLTLTGMNNILSFPLAVEYRINAVAIRLGTHINYNISEHQEEQNNSNVRHWIDQELDWTSSCGIGWRLGSKFNFDLYKEGISLQGNDIEICFKFIF